MRACGCIDTPLRINDSQCEASKRDESRAAAREYELAKLVVNGQARDQRSMQAHAPLVTRAVREPLIHAIDP
jgi:hypothetical protein